MLEQLPISAFRLCLWIGSSSVRGGPPLAVQPTDRILRFNNVAPGIQTGIVLHIGALLTPLHTTALLLPLPGLTISFVGKYTHPRILAECPAVLLLLPTKGEFVVLRISSSRGRNICFIKVRRVMPSSSGVVARAAMLNAVPPSVIALVFFVVP
jgi:hypothetical protein